MDSPVAENCTGLFIFIKRRMICIIVPAEKRIADKNGEHPTTL
jgi:hypothetical protein